MQLRPVGSLRTVIRLECARVLGKCSPGYCQWPCFPCLKVSAVDQRPGLCCALCVCGCVCGCTLLGKKTRLTEFDHSVCLFFFYLNTYNIVSVQTLNTYNVKRPRPW